MVQWDRCWLQEWKHSTPCTLVSILVETFPHIGHWAFGHWGIGAFGHWGIGALGHWGVWALGHWGVSF